MFSCHAGNKASTNKSHEYFSLLDIVNSHYMTSTRGHCFGTHKKRVHHLVLMMTPSMCIILLFCISLLLTSSSFYLSPEICFPETSLVFNVPIFYVTLKVFISFFKNLLFRMAKMFFKNTYIVRSFLVIPCPCQ